MYDLHNHLLPGIDDGATDISVSIEMARAAAESGTMVMACTPHYTPGVWSNIGPDIRARAQQLQAVLYERGIPLQLTTGCDMHVNPDMIEGLRTGRLLSLNDTRYVLLELPHHAAPARLDDCFFGLLSAGYIPIFTHPERVGWIQNHYDSIKRLARSGVWMQITAGSLVGSFGSRARYWAEKMLDEGLVHILASDAHDMKKRPPQLREGREIAAQWVGDYEAYNLTVARPYGILCNQPPASLPPVPERQPVDLVAEIEKDDRPGAHHRSKGFFQNILSRL